MNTPKVSVIIPVYNTEAYVRETVESILYQSLQDLEIIVINDGSTDHSLEILNELAATDPRILLFSQANQGLSVTRNKGMSHAHGEFIYFMDSDDLLHPGALQTCYEKCIKENLDFVFFDAENIGAGHLPSIRDYTHSGAEKQEISEGIDWLNFQMDTYTYFSPVWLNFIRHSYLQQLDLMFYPGIIHEDQLFTSMLYLNARRVGYIPIPFFKRRLRENSIMTSKFSWKNILGYITVTGELLKYQATGSAKVRTTIDKYLRSMLNAVTWNAHVLSFKEKLHLLLLYNKKHCMKYIRLRNLLVLFFKA